MTFLLRRNNQTWISHAARLQELFSRLEQANVPMTTQDGRETQGALLIKALKFLHAEATEIVNVNLKIDEELTALAEQYDAGHTPDQAVQTMVACIKATNTKYAQMDDETVRKELGL